MDVTDLRAALAPGGELRVAINTGNRALVQQDGERLEGVSPALARRLATLLGVEARMLVFPGAGATVAAADEWDVGFLAVDAERMDRVVFTRPYVVIEGTVAVRRGGPVTRLADLDQPGCRVMVARGAAYDLALSRDLKQAAIVREANPGASFEAFASGQCDAVAGVRQSLERRFGTDPAYLIFDEPILTIEQAMALPRRHEAVLPALNAFLARARDEGFVRAALDASGQGGLRVPQ